MTEPIKRTETPTMPADAQFCGVLPLIKPSGITSHDAVNRIRRIYGTKQVGHTGTLDPLASGLLIILVGRAVKASEFVMAGEKAYTATLRLGIATDTDDITGKIISQSEMIPSPNEVIAAAERFCGDIMQVPPAYSAIKTGGRKLLDYARAGQTAEVPARPVTVSQLDVLPLSDTDYRLEITCSKGTYIRAICRDIGILLGCGGTMATLERTCVGGFGLDAAYTFDRLDGMSREEKQAALMPLETLFSDLPQVSLPDFFSHLAHNGLEIYQKKIGTAYPCGTIVRFSDSEGFFALGRAENYPDGSAIKPIKQF